MFGAKPADHNVQVDVAPVVATRRPAAVVGLLRSGARTAHLGVVGGAEVGLVVEYSHHQVAGSPVVWPCAFNWALTFVTLVAGSVSPAHPAAAIAPHKPRTGPAGASCLLQTVRAADDSSAGIGPTLRPPVAQHNPFGFIYPNCGRRFLAGS